MRGHAQGGTGDALRLQDAGSGLTPRQHSSGGRTRLGRISLRSNVYVRTLLIQGARSTLQSAINAEPSRANRLQRWIIALYGRKGYHKTLVAIANKHARILWAMLAKEERYDALAWQRHPWQTPIGSILNRLRTRISGGRAPPVGRNRDQIATS